MHSALTARIDGQKERIMSTIKELVESKKCRTGKAAGTTKRGAYWIAVGPVLLRDYGGDGIGNNSPDMKNYLYLRHYRSEEVQATVCCESWHQNTGDREQWESFPELLDCETVEDVIVALKSWRFFDSPVYSDVFESNVTEAMTDLGLPLAAPSPDEVTI